MTFSPPLAHIGHWYMWILYLVPVLIVLAASFHALLDHAIRQDDRADLPTSCAPVARQ